MTLVLKDFQGNLATDPAFQAWVMAKAEASVSAGALAVAAAHLKILAGWNGKPSFDSKSLSEFSRLLALREVRVTGPNAWKWLLVNYGGPEVNIDLSGTRRFMRFPFQGRGASYNAATDSGAPGRRLGPVIKAQRVSGRKIRARNLIGQVSRNDRQTIYSAMRSGFNGAT